MLLFQPPSPLLIAQEIQMSTGNTREDCQDCPHFLSGANGIIACLDKANSVIFTVQSVSSGLIVTVLHGLVRDTAIQIYLFHPVQCLFSLKSIAADEIFIKHH